MFLRKRKKALKREDAKEPGSLAFIMKKLLVNSKLRCKLF